MKHLIINEIPIELEQKRIKNMYLRILPPDGRVHISAPYRMSEEEVIRFVTSRLDWIVEEQVKLQQRNVAKDIEYVTGDEISIWGSRFTLTVVDHSSRNTVKIEEDKIILYVKSGSTAIQRSKILNTYYRQLLLQVIPPFFLKWERIIGVNSSGLTIRDMKTRWGTCNVRTRKICLNLQLAKKPPKCLEYVIVHELVHLLERSHNSIFKGYMDKYLPQWRIIKKELNTTVS